VTDFEATQTTFTFALAAPALVLVEFGALLHAERRGAPADTSGGAALELKVGIDGQAPSTRRARYQINDTGGNFALGEANIEGSDAVNLGAGPHTLLLYVFGSDLACFYDAPWLKATRL
jgi:hypothetical protein